MKCKYFLMALAMSPLFSWSQQQKFLVPYRHKNLWGFCDTLGNVVIAPAYDSTGFVTSYFTSPGLGKIYSKKKEGIISISGKVLIPPVYDKVDYVSGFNYFEVYNSSRTMV